MIDLTTLAGPTTAKKAAVTVPAATGEASAGDFTLTLASFLDTVPSDADVPLDATTFLSGERQDVADDGNDLPQGASELPVDPALAWLVAGQPVSALPLPSAPLVQSVQSPITAEPGIAQVDPTGPSLRFSPSSMTPAFEPVPPTMTGIVAAPAGGPAIAPEERLPRATIAAAAGPAAAVIPANVPAIANPGSEPAVRAALVSSDDAGRPARLSRLTEASALSIPRDTRLGDQRTAAAPIPLMPALSELPSRATAAAFARAGAIDVGMAALARRAAAPQLRPTRFEPIAGAVARGPTDTMAATAAPVAIAPAMVAPMAIMPTVLAPAANAAVAPSAATMPGAAPTLATENSGPGRAISTTPSLPAAVIAPAAPAVLLAQPKSVVAPVARALTAGTVAEDQRPEPSSGALATPSVDGVARPVPTITPAAHGAPIDLRHDDGLQRMIDRIEVLRDDANARDTRIRLIPDALGPVDVSVRRQGETLHVHFTAQSAATATLIADAQPRLTELADARGVKLGQATIDGNGAQGSGQHRPRAAPTAPNRVAPSATDPMTTDDRIA